MFYLLLEGVTHGVLIEEVRGHVPAWCIWITGGSAVGEVHSGA